VPALLVRLLAKSSLARNPALEADFVEALCLHDWPFNVREVVLLAKRLAVLHGHEASLKASFLPARMQRVSGASDAPEVQFAHSSEAEPVEFPALIAALRASSGNVAQAAAVLGISRQRAYRLMHGQAVDLDALRKQDDEP
jgi:transcriptional regulator of acetoin/glycerol metabolism